MGQLSYVRYIVDGREIMENEAGASLVEDNRCIGSKVHLWRAVTAANSCRQLSVLKRETASGCRMLAFCHYGNFAGMVRNA